MEIELKLAPVKPDTGKAILENEPFYTSDIRTVKMDAEYYDTPDRDLKKHGVSLRLRKENAESVCCLKIRQSDISRHEFEENALSIETGISALCKRPDIPESIKQLISTSSLVCLFSSHYTRLFRLAQSGASTIEITYDRGYLKQGSRSCGISETELELKDGDENDLKALCAYLQAKYTLSLSLSTKAGRAAALTKDAFSVLSVYDTSNLSKQELSLLFDCGKLWRDDTKGRAVYYKTDKY